MKRLFRGLGLALALLLVADVALAQRLTVTNCGQPYCGPGTTNTTPAVSNPTSCAAVTDSDVQAWCTSVTFANTSGPELTILTTMVQGIKADLGITTLNQKFDRFSIWALGTQAAAVGEFANRVSSTVTGTPTFTPNKGFTGTHAASCGNYILPNYTMSSAVNLTQNLAGAYFAIQTMDPDTTTFNVNFGTSGGGETFNGLTKSNATQLGYALNGSNNGSDTYTSAGVVAGRYTIERTGASAQQLYLNGSQVATGTWASGALSTRTNMPILSGTNSGTAGFHCAATTMGAYYFGTSLGATNVQKVDARIYAALHALSATFYP